MIRLIYDNWLGLFKNRMIELYIVLIVYEDDSVKWSLCCASEMCRACRRSNVCWRCSLDVTMVRSRGHELPFLADVVQSTGPLGWSNGKRAVVEARKMHSGRMERAHFEGGKGVQHHRHNNLFFIISSRIFPKSEPGTLTYKNVCHCLGNREDSIWETVMRGNAHAVVHLRMIHQFLKLVYLRIRVRK